MTDLALSRFGRPAAKSRGRSFRIAPYLFLLPALGGMALFIAYPIIHSVIGSTQQEKFSPSGFVNEFVGFGNYSDLFHSAAFWHSLKITAIFNLVTNPFQIAVALALALFVNSSVRGARFYLAAIIVPLTISLPVACVLWQIIFEPSTGLANGILTTIGLPQQGFLESSGQALWVITFIATWQGACYWMLFLLAGLQSIPSSLYEVADLDGASPIRRFWHVTLPLLRRPLLFVLVADTVSNFFLFTPQYLLTHGGPGGSTNVLMYQAYNTAFNFSDFGHALAMMTILVVVAAVVIAFQFRLLQSED
jgi:multiple sugar transport system permease protein